MDHPAVVEIMRTGYAEKEPDVVGSDALGNEVYKGDEILVFEDEIFLTLELSSETIEVLEIVGAEYQTA